MKRYFILGTDTNCGKTYVTCQLLDYFKNLSQRTLAIKPVISGIDEDDSYRCLLRHSESRHQPLFKYSFKRPISPHLAAAEEGKVISVQDIINFCFHSKFSGHDYLWIEGAGGLMVPLNSTQTWIDALLLSQIPIILVVGMRLGCLNHALLTALALSVHKLPCVGWIANCVDPNMLALQENINTLSKKIAFPLLATIAYEGKLERLDHSNFLSN